MEATPETADDALETRYRCLNGCGPILILSTRGVVSWEGRGYRVDDWLIRNPCDLLVTHRSALRPYVFPASPHALD